MLARTHRSLLALLAAFCGSLLLATPHVAQEEDGFHFQEGRVTVGGGLAVLDLAPGWSCLPELEAQFVVEELWENPPDDTILGLVYPPGEEPTWAVVVSYEEDGHVEDEDASDIDYDDLMASMQADARDSNAARRAAGYATAEVLGWAATPHYDSAHQKLFWAKLLQFSGNPEPTLNYDVRILGRRGVLVLSAVSDESQLDLVEDGMQELLGRTEFLPGNRYEDFEPGVDHVAAYGIAGLVAGKVLAKAGFFKMFLLLLAKGWKVVLLALAGLGTVVAKARARS